MAKTIEQILGYVSLTGVIQAVKTGIPDNLPKQFYSNKKGVIGDAGRYTQVRGTRKTARLVQYGAPPFQRALVGVESKDVKLMHSYESITLDPLVLQHLRNYDNYDLQDMGVQEVDRQQMQFRQLFDNLELSAKYMMLSKGAIYFDGDGNLLPTSSGAVTTIDFGVSANNKNQLNGIIAASWANQNTDIPSHLRNLKLRSAELTGYPLKYAFYGVNIPSYLTQNNYVLDYLSRNVNMSQRFLDQAELPDGLFGFTWIPVYTSFFEDSAGTNQTIFGDDQVVFTPDIDQSVYELLEGTSPVPTTFNAVSDAAAALGTIKMVQGMFSYAVPIMRPPTVEMCMGFTSLCAWKVPDTLFIADTVP